MSENRKTTVEQFEQLQLPIPSPRLTWIVVDRKSIPLITPDNVKDFSRERTGNTNLGTRIVHSIERALGYDPYNKPAPQGYSPEEVLSVLTAAKHSPNDMPYWWLGASSIQLFQEFCIEVQEELAET